MKRWYVIQVKSKQEDLAKVNLEKQKFRTYNPQTIITKVFRNETTHVAVALFAGYMFVEFDIDEDNWRTIRNTRGVYNLLTATEDNCHALPKGFVEELKQKADKTGCIPTEKTEQLLRDYVIGDQLTIKDGVFAGFTGICERVHKDRIIILLSLLGGKRALELPVTSVLPVQ